MNLLRLNCCIFDYKLLNGQIYDYFEVDISDFQLTNIEKFRLMTFLRLTCRIFELQIIKRSDL